MDCDVIAAPAEADPQSAIAPNAATLMATAILRDMRSSFANLVFIQGTRANYRMACFQVPRNLNIYREFIAHNSRVRFGSLNHAPGDAINPQGPIAADANALILGPLSGHSRHGGAYG